MTDEGTEIMERNVSCGQTNQNELDNHEKLDSVSYLYSWRNIMQRFKDLPFDEINSSRVHREITEWYHRVMQIQDLSSQPHGTAAASPSQPEGTHSSPTEIDPELPVDMICAHDGDKDSDIVPYSRDLKGKYRCFIWKQISSTEALKHHSWNTDINVHRESVFLDSFNKLGQLSEDKIYLLRSNIHIRIHGEPVLPAWKEDVRTIEWFTLLSKAMFNPRHGLFKYAANGDTLQINPESGLADQNHLEHLKFVGRVVGMAVFQLKQLPEGFFIRPFYKMMLGMPVTLADMEHVDVDCFRSLSWIKDNDPSGHGLTFTMDENVFGNIVEKELIPGGRHVLVTKENKQLYIEKIIEWRFVSRIKEQMDHFMEGFNDVIPLDKIKTFDEGELEFLLCGITHKYMYLDANLDKYIDVNAWRRNTKYVGYTEDDDVVLWFWSIVSKHFINETRARLLQFVTGTAKVPINGDQEHYFSNGPDIFTIDRWGTPGNLPRALISSNRLELPPYEKFSDLKENLIMAVERSAGFEGQN